MSSRKLSALRACGADDGTANRTPSAWMISLVVFLAQRQIVFFVWVTFGERKWSILAERRGVTPPADKTAKVALFRSLFRGREDVYAERWRMRDAPSGTNWKPSPTTTRMCRRLGAAGTTRRTSGGARPL
jgi:hypothetical protein